MIQLRQYQSELIESVRSSLRSKHKRVVLCAPTGAGKTIMFTFIASNTIKNNGNILILTHRSELLNQSGSTFEKFDLQPEFITAGSKPDLSARLHVGMVETIYRRIDELKEFLLSKTLIIIDECHINSFTKIFEHLNTSSIVIGATATPYRKGKDVQSLSDFYTDLVQEIDTPDLIQLGFLCKALSYGVEIDTKGLKTTGEDYDTKKYYEETKMYQGVVDNYNRLTPNKKALLFASNVKSSQQVCDEFIQNGYDARHIDANTPDDERTRILTWFENSIDGILCNCGILTAGYDCPSIEVVILYRATTSLPLFLQMCGRGSRPTEYKDSFYILDFGNNIQRLGFWEERRKWSLSKDEKRQSDKQEAVFIKICKKCGAMLYPSAKVCQYCGAEVKKTHKEIIVELELLTPSERWKQDLPTKVLMCKNGLMNGFAVLHRMTNKEEAREFIRLMEYKKGFEYINKHRFKVLQ